MWFDTCLLFCSLVLSHKLVSSLLLRESDKSGFKIPKAFIPKRRHFLETSRQRFIEAAFTMNYGHKTPTTSYTRSTSSIYSNRSVSNLQSQKSRSMKSVTVPWYQKPILANNKFLTVQSGAMFAALFSMFVAVFTVLTAIFDLYCLSMAAPGAVHYGYYFISYEFVYVGNRHVRNLLAMFALFSMIAGFAVFVTSVMLMLALRREHERKFHPWLIAFGIFAVLRFLAFLLFSIVNDLTFGYNLFMCVTWFIFVGVSFYAWMNVYTLYLELSGLTKLEDLAHLRMGTLASLHGSANPSIYSSRPITPYTVSTLPMH